ncbi:MAG: hypothetical protein ACREM3_23460, partial [Candidatus Rokuibacteriota bacterium]
MARQPFRLTGLVRNRATGAPLPGLRVEAWDRDTRYHDMLGVDITDGEGRFTIRFDEEYYGDFAPDRLPDVYFRVLREDQVLGGTEDSIIRNLRERDRDVVIDVDLPAEEPAAADRVSAGQVYASISWFKQSDFRGVFNDGVDRVRTFGRLGAELTKGAVARASLSPLESPSVRERDVVGQDTVTASANLERQNVSVQDVRVYTPGERVAVVDIARTPVNLKAGDRVTLYQDSRGVVRYYTIVRDPAPTDIQAEDVARLDREVKAVRADVTQLAAVRASVAEVKAASEARSLEITTDVETVKRDLAAVEQMKTEVEVLRRSAVERERQVKVLQEELTRLRTNFEQLTPRRAPAPARRPRRAAPAPA